MLFENSHPKEKSFFIYKEETHLLSPSLNWERERTSPSGNLLSHLVDLLDLTTSDLGLEVLELVVTLWESTLDFLADLDTLINVVCDLGEVVLTETTRCHGWCTDTDTAWGESGLVTWDGVLVASNVDLLENSLDTGTIKCLRTEIKKNHVRIGSISDQLVVELLELNLKGLGVLDDLLLVVDEVRGGSLLESNSKSGNGVVVGSTLVTWEDRKVDWVLEIIKSLLSSLGINLADTLSEEDHGTTRTTEGLVGGCGHDIGVLERAWDDTSGDEARDVSHVNNEVSTDEVCNLTHTSIVDETAVCRGTGNENLRSVHQGILLQLLIINDASLKVDTVWEGFEVGGDGRNPR